MARPRNVVYDPEKFGRTATDYIMLTKVNSRPLKHLVNGSSPWIRIGMGQLSLHENEASFPWMDMGYVVTDQPRDAILTQLIQQNTTGFAVADTRTTEIVAHFKDFEACLKAVQDANEGLRDFGDDEPQPVATLADED